MDKQDYLNQISATSKPLKQGKKGIFSSIYFKLGVGAVVAFIILVIIDVILSSGRGGVKQDSIALKVHLDNTMEMITTYQTDVKSSSLRSSSASLYGVLSNTNSALTKYLEDNYDFRERDVDDKTASEAEAAKEELNTELFSAKINGILDRIYAHKMAYEIAIIASNENSLRKQTDDEALLSIIDTSYNSLNNLYNQFNDFSETK